MKHSDEIILKFANAGMDFLLAMLLTFKIINYSIVNILRTDAETGYLKTIFIFMLVCFIVLSFILMEFHVCRVPLTVLVFLTFVGLLYFIFFNHSDLAITEFIVYVVFAIFMGIRQDINVEKTLLYTMIISLIALPCFKYIFLLKWYGGLNMDISYAFLPPIIAAIIHYSYFYKEVRKRRVLNPYILLYIVNFIYLLQIILYGERGTLVCIAVAIIFTLFIRFEHGKLIERNFPIKVIVLLMIGVICFIFFKDILKILVDVFSIDIYAINKFISLLDSGDFSNGRLELYKQAIAGITRSPLWGNGVSTFNYFTENEYPHNLILQLLYDGGWILLIFVLFIFIHNTKILIKNGDKNQIIWIMFLLPISVVYLMFSQNIWKVPSMWILLGYLCSYSGKRIKI